MEIIIKPYTSYSESEILPLYAEVGWTNYTRKPNMLKEAYENSLLILAAYDIEEQFGTETEINDSFLGENENRIAPVGILRAVGDGHSIIYIQDIIVLPSYQRNGIGRRLILSLLEGYKDVYQIVLMTEDIKKNVSFYESCGLSNVRKFGCTSFLKMNV